MKQHATNGVRGLSRVFHFLDDVTTRAATSGIVLVGVLAALIAIGIFGVSSDMQYAFATAASAITLVMVFVIQHTQSRHQLALQIKLDELLHALPQADDRFVHVEAGSDRELHELEHRHLSTHQELRSADEPEVDGDT